MNSRNIRLLLVALFFLALAGSVVVQVSHVDYPVTGRSGDGSRDYLIARHIASEGDVPLLGPAHGGSGGTIPNSPAYWYLLGGLVALADDILFLEMAGVALWAAGTAFLFFFAYLAFGLPVAFLGGLLHILVSISWAGTGEGMWHFSYLWQPIFMVPFFFFALFLLALGYRKRSLPFLFASIVAWTFAGAVHNAAFLFFPFLLLSIVLLLRAWKTGTAAYASVAAVTFASMLLWYMPVFVYAFSQDLSVLDVRGVSSSLSSDSFSASFHAFMDHLEDAFRRVFPQLPPQIPLLAAGAGAIYFSPLGGKSREAKVIVALLLSAVLFHIFLLSFLPVPQPFYLFPAYGLLAIAGIEILRGLVFRSFILKFAAVLLALAAFQSLVQFSVLGSIIAGSDERLRNRDVMAEATAVLAREVRSLQQQERIAEPDFFNIASFYRVRTPESYILEPIHDAVLWAPLEQEFERRFTRQTVQNSFTVLGTDNRDSVIFIACHDVIRNDSQEWCLDAFRERARNYAAPEELFRSPFLSIHMVKKETEEGNQTVTPTRPHSL